MNTEQTEIVARHEILIDTLAALIEQQGWEPDEVLPLLISSIGALIALATPPDRLDEALDMSCTLIRQRAAAVAASQTASFQ